MKFCDAEIKILGHTVSALVLSYILLILNKTNSSRTRVCEVSFAVDKDVYRTDREVEKYKGSNSHSLTQLEDILTTYVMYNLDLGNALLHM